MKYLLYALTLLPILSACGSGGAGTIPSPVLHPAGSITSEAQSDLRQPLSTPPVSSTNDLLYVANAGNNSITVYKHNANGDAAPERVIAGNKTGISGPGQLSEDSQGNLYVANSTNILVFARGAGGNVAPIRTIAGAKTGLQYVTALTVDQTTGKIFAFNEGPSDGASDLLRFAPNATGNTAPFAQSAIDLPPAFQLASDSSGQNVIEANMPPCCEDSLAGVETWPKQFANGTDLFRTYDVTALQTVGVADDPTTKTYLTTDGTTIYRLAEDTNGNFPFNGNPEKLSPPLVSTITNACAGQLALGYLRNIYTTCGNAIYVYTHDSSGNVPPLRIVRGTATGLNQPTGIYEGQ